MILQRIASPTAPQNRSPDAPYSLARAVREFEQKYVQNVIRLTEGNLDEAAALIGISPQDIRDLLEERFLKSLRPQKSELTEIS